MEKNIAQEEVINNIYGQTIVIACPGSGKTTTLLRRIHHMVEDENIDPNEILMITFTKAAAKEMSDRYKEKFGGNPGIIFSTIHALCFTILRQFKNYQYDDILTDAEEVIYKAISKISTINDKTQFVKDILMDISVVKNNNIDINKYEPKCCDNSELFIKIFKLYEKHKQEQNKVDFDDILLETYKLLKNNREILDIVKDRFGYIHVDEYQDTNFIQRDIIYLIAGNNGNLCVVGDDDQSIYAFRGARPEIMLNFKKDYPYAKEIYMSTNYRSCSDIIKYASNLIQKNKSRYDKDIIAFNKKRGSVRFDSFSNKSTEIEALGQMIQNLINKGVSPNNIAVLYRTNSQSVAVADKLISLNIPFQSNETIQSKYTHWMFKDIISYHKIATNTGTQNDFYRTVNHPNRYMSKINIKNCDLNLKDMYNALKNPYIEEWKNQKTMENIKKYLNLIKYLENQSPEKFTTILWKIGGYERYIEDYTEFRNENSNELFNIWNSYLSDITSKKFKTMDEWLLYANRYNIMFEKKQKEKNGICLSTMHKSKGLEWEYVFIIDCVEGTTPSDKSESISEIEEERRLFYVAMTRAKKVLYMMAHNSCGGKKTTISRFIKESLK